MHGKRMRDNGQLKHEGFRLDLCENFHHEDSQALERVDHRGCVVSILGEFKARLSNLIIVTAPDLIRS